MNFPFDSENKEQKLLIARLDDFVDKRDKGYVSHSDFLTPAEQYIAEKYLASHGLKDRICFFGGYFAAERKQIFLLPDYLGDILSDSGADFYDILREDYEAAISTLEIKGSSYRKLDHRDYLGSVLSLGIKRTSIGDICIFDDCSAVIFCTANAGKLIISELERIGNDKVSVRAIKPDVNMGSCVKFSRISDTVASRRIDCIVAALCGLPREKSQNLIKGGFCEHNYCEENALDSEVKENDVISVRGYGKFIIRAVSNFTKKGRIRLEADKYI